MFKIGDFSKMGQVSVRMLRHYDKLGLLKPSEVDDFTGYRYYTLDQLQRLNRILALQDLGLSLKQVGELIDDDMSVEKLEGMLSIKQAELEQQIFEEQQRLHRVQARLRLIKAEENPRDYEVVIKKTSQLAIASMRTIVPSADTSTMKAYRCTMSEDIYAWLKKHAIKPTDHEMVMYHNPEFKETDIDMEFGIPISSDVIDELGNRSQGDLKFYRLDADYDVASIIHTGDIRDIPQALIAITSWVRSNGYDYADSLREIHLSGPEHGLEDIRNVTFEFQQPIKSR